MPVHRVDKRSTEAAHAFARELRGRVIGAPQITSDGLKAYVEAIEAAFGSRVQFAQILKTYAKDEASGASRDDVRYSRGRVTRSVKRVVIGAPDEAKIGTSYIERSNLTIRMGQRRFTRLTNAFSKRLEHLRAAVALHFAFYNFCRVHMTLRVTPAMEAGLTDHVWSVEELVTEAYAALESPPPPPLPPPPRRGGTFGRRPTSTATLPRPTIASGGAVMAREVIHLRLGELPVEVHPDGRVLVTLPPTVMPFGCACRATVLYPSLRAFLAASVLIPSR